MAEMLIRACVHQLALESERRKAFEEAAGEVNAETLSADPSGLCWSLREGVMPFAVSLEKRLRALAKAEEQADG